ncbi:MAG: tryptophan synthase subunit alpha, partial [Polaromonas sp.]
MSRIAATFSQLKSQGRKALIPYVTAGFPFADVTPELMHSMVAGGADVIELGVPFSDPSADGPVIQKAGEKALSLGIGLVQVLEMVRVFRRKDHLTPVVLMGYANPVERYDIKHGAGGSESAFIRDAAEAGVDGVLIVDYPPEECLEFAARLRAHNMDLIFLLAPTSTDERMAQVAEVASGYVYYVSLKGVTGAGTLDVGAVE